MNQIKLLADLTVGVVGIGTPIIDTVQHPHVPQACSLEVLLDLLLYLDSQVATGARGILYHLHLQQYSNPSHEVCQHPSPLPCLDLVSVGSPAFSALLKSGSG